LLCVLGIALGVAVVVAIDLANESARRAFNLAAESVTGRATHYVIGGPTGVDETVYSRLRVEGGERLVAPVIEGYVLVEDLGRGQFRLLGVDPFAEPTFRSYLSPDAGLPLDALVPLLAEPNTVLLPEEVAARFGIAPGDTVRVLVGSRLESLRVVGLLSPADEFSRRALSDLLLTDVATAQEVLGQVGWLSRIDVFAPQAQPEGRARLVRIAAMLPPGVRVTEATTRTQAVQQLTGAFELNLTALSLLALVVGTFLIYNMMTFSVVQRRQTIGTMRSLGVTRREVFGLVLVEAGLLGALGSLLGLALGIALSRGALSLVTQTINDLYFVVTVRGVAVSPLVLAKGAGLGVLAALAAALGPAYEATSVPPVSTLQRSTVESRAQRLIPAATIGGITLLMIGALLLALPARNLIASFAGVLAIILGFAALTPGITLLIAHLTTRSLGYLLGPVGRMAPRAVSGALSRTGLAIAALMVAVSVSIGVGLMIDAFRLTVERWLDSTLQADVYISAPGFASNRADGSLDPALEARVAVVPGVETVEAVRNGRVESPDMGSVAVVAARWLRPRQSSLFVCAPGGPARAQAILADGAVLLSEPFAYRHRLTCGDDLILLTDAVPRSFPVAGVFYDYSSDQGLVRLDLDLYRALWRDPLISSLAVYAAPDEDVDELVVQLRNDLAGEALLIRSNRGLREAALGVFDRTFAITYALQLLAILVAFIGVLSALMALQLERTREFGTLRAIGLTPSQLWRLTLLETGLMGAMAGVLALPAGLALAAILVYVINRRSFGWTIQFAIAPDILVQALLIAILAALLAGLYPAWRLARISPADALRNE
jgi:putative ABC transport system permease protein